MENNTIKWFDVSRFGAELRVLPATALRNKTLTCLDVFDEKLFSHCFTKYINPDEIHIKFNDALEALGFRNEQQRIHDTENDREIRRYHSTKTDFSLNELRGLFPDLLASDIAHTTKNKIVIAPGLSSTEINQWKTFANEKLAEDAKRVWTPVVNPYTKTSYEDSQDISELYRSLPVSGLTRSIAVTRSGHSSYGLLVNAQYRTNSLVEYYPDRESAVRDGRYAEKDLMCVDLPYAAPLWLTENNRVIAIADIRHCPELMSKPPHEFYNTEDRSLIVTALREADGVAKKLTSTIEQWNEWTADKDSFRRTATPQFVKSIQDVAELLYRAHEANAHLPIFSQMQDDAARRDGTFKVSGIGEITNPEIKSTAHVMARYLPYLLDDENREALSEKIVDMKGIALDVLKVERLKAVESQRQADLAHLASIVSTSSAEISTENAGSKLKHVDTGEKIGGARKDFARRAMTIDDLVSMNELERKTSVVKKNIWPPLDYEAMRENGVKPEVAMAIKYVKDKLNTVPTGDHYRLSGDNPAGDYIEAIATVRDAMVEVKTMEEFKAAMEALYEKGITLPNGDKKTNSVYGHTQLQVQWGEMASHLFHDSNSDRSVAFEIRREIRRKVPEDSENPGSDRQWAGLIKTKRKKSEAEIESEQEKNRIDRELHRPHLEHLVRSGGTDLRQGRDVTADDLINTFGFRAVEWGNYLPQNERQEVINMAFDAFTDLAEAMQVPPRAVSLGARDDTPLALAFGARGTGGKNAALAHFETGRFVINLTRLNGAGCLSHEVGHGLDSILASKNGFASHNARTEGMRNVFRAMHHRDSSDEELYAHANAEVKRGSENAARWIAHERDNWNANMIKLRERNVEVIDQIYPKLYQKVVASFSEKIKSNSPIVLEQNYGEFNRDDIDKAKDVYMLAMKSCVDGSIKKKNREQAELNSFHSMKNLALTATISAARDLNVELPKSFYGTHSVHTDYFKEAQKLDKTRSSPYWATTHEMFARAFACYVHDKLDEKGIRSDYLVHGADEGRHANNVYGNPNTAGLDRKNINEAFDVLMEEYRLEYARSLTQSSVCEPS